MATSNQENTKKRLAPCKDKVDKLLSTLNDKAAVAEVAEYVSCLKFVSICIDDYCKLKDKERPAVQDEGKRAEKLTKELEELLVSVNKNDKLVRYCSNVRVRRGLDRLHSQLYKELAQITSSLPKKKIDPKKVNPKDLVTSNILDDEGRQLWDGTFGQSVLVEWSRFLEALRPYGQISEDCARQLKYVLDISNTGFVSAHRFGDFLTGFGPLRNCIYNLVNILNMPWFHGYLSSKEAEKLLLGMPVGTFLVRFTKAKPGNFAVAYTDTNGGITNTLIVNAQPSGFKVQEAHSNIPVGRVFPLLSDVVQFYAYLLKMPLMSDLTRQPIFHGELSSDEAEEILSGHPSGTYLFRFSSKPGYLSVSYVARNQVVHGLLEPVPGGFRFDNQPNVCQNLQEVVYSLPDLLKTPLTNLTWDPNYFFY